MGIARIVLQIDREIARLQRARALLNGGASKIAGQIDEGTRRSRKKKRKLTPEGRKRISEAVRRRWERQRKAASGKQSK